VNNKDEAVFSRKIMLFKILERDLFLKDNQLSKKPSFRRLEINQ